MNIRCFFFDGADYKTGVWMSAQNAYEENCIEFKGEQLVPTDECTIINRGIGLKDSNNKEFYEGDIYRCYFPSHLDEDGNETHKEYRYVVEYKPVTFGIAFTIAQHPSNCKIIGNIYENPELLK